MRAQQSQKVLLPPLPHAQAHTSSRNLHLHKEFVSKGKKGIQDRVLGGNGSSDSDKEDADEEKSNFLMKRKVGESTQPLLPNKRHKTNEKKSEFQLMKSTP